MSHDTRELLRELEARELLRELEARELAGGISHSTLWAWRRDHGFPEPIRIGPRAVRYRRAEIVEWLASRPRAGEEGSNTTTS